MEEFKQKSKKTIYWLTIGIILIVVYKTLDQLPNIAQGIGTFFKSMQPILLGIFIAYILYIPCQKVENLFRKSKIKFVRNKSRVLGIFVIYVLVALIIWITLTWIGPIIADSAVGLFNNLEHYVQTSIQKYNSLPEDSYFKSQIIAGAIDKISNIDFTQYINMDLITQYAKSALGVFKTLFNVLISIIVSIYVLNERTRIQRFLKKLARAVLKTHTYKMFSKYFDSANRIFIKFITSQMLDAIIMSILSSIVLSIMGVKYPALLGLIIGTLNIIPYVGAIIGVAIAAIITLITGGFSQAIWMIIIVTIVQQIDANIINPKIIGSSLKISPLLVIISITIGGLYGGAWGIFLSVPICALIKIITEDYIDYKMVLQRRERELKRQEQENIEQ